MKYRLLIFSLAITSCSTHESYLDHIPISTRLRLMRVPMPWHETIVCEASGERVVFLHGLRRSHFSMNDLALDFHERGYETVNILYPSFRASLNEITKHIEEQLRDSKKKTHYVTHSMGGILVRKLAHDYPELVTGRIVMLAPPNQGSAIIDWVVDCPFVRWTLGPSGVALSSESVQKDIPGLNDLHEVGVIMGNKPDIRLFQSLLEGENDGIVTVKGGKIDGVKQQVVLPSNHTFIMAHPHTKIEVAHFISEGSFK